MINLNNKKDFILSEKEMPCKVCRKLTKQIEIYFEARVCSDECQAILINRYMKETTLKDNEL